MNNPAREYIQRIRERCNAAIKRGEQIDFCDALVISRPTGENASYWLHMMLRKEQWKVKILLEACKNLEDVADHATPTLFIPHLNEAIKVIREAIATVEDK